MKNHFTADGHQRWLKSRAASKQKAAPALTEEQKPAGLPGKIQRWWRTEVPSLPQTKEEKEKSSPKILW